MTDAQLELLRDKYVLWDRASREGAMDLRDYNRRCADALGQLLAEHSAAFPARREVSVEDVARCLDAWSTEPGDLAPPYRWKNRRAEATAILALFSPREASGEAGG